MILEPDQFEKYKTTMGERVIEVSKQQYLCNVVGKRFGRSDGR